VKVVLASASPARLSTLRAAGVDPVAVVSGVDESGFSAPSPAELAQRLATAKARTVACMPEAGEATFVVGCDSLLDLDGEALGKAADRDHVRQRWRRMRGRSGVLVTGHCVIESSTGREAAATAATTVHFAAISDDEIDRYVATGEPETVAGGFTIDGLGGAFVSGVEGDPHNVVGISLPLLRDLVHSLGTSWPDLWS
jgi:septum formation protein